MENEKPELEDRSVVTDINLSSGFVGLQVDVDDIVRQQLDQQEQEFAAIVEQVNQELEQYVG